MSEVADLLDGAQALRDLIAIRGFVEPDVSVRNTSGIDVLRILAMNETAYVGPRAGELLTAVHGWLQINVLHRVIIDQMYVTLVEVGHGFVITFDGRRFEETAAALVQAARDIGLFVTPNGDAVGLERKCPAVPARAFAEDSDSEAPFWSFDDVRTACDMQAARPAIAAVLGDLAADRVLAFAAPALPLRALLPLLLPLRARPAEEARRWDLSPTTPSKCREGAERPPTEDSAAKPAAAALEAELLRREAERRGQDVTTRNDEWIARRQTLWISLAGVVAGGAASFPGLQSVGQAPPGFYEPIGS